MKKQYLVQNKVKNKQFDVYEKKKWLARTGKVGSYPKIERNFK